ncbi:MAG: hypothetical protein LBS45_12120 [Synergistaceae bacterium]|nr:hypothetical protein [Synergistaceae bacterium]
MKFSEFVRLFSEAELQRGVRRKCPYCDSEDWTIYTVHRAIMLLGVDPTKLPFANTPCILMTCDKCGAIHLVDPRVLGLDFYLREKIEEDDE